MPPGLVEQQHGVVIIGKQGTGKSFLGHAMQKLLGPKNVTTLPGDDLDSQWNAKLANKVLTVIEEMMAQDRLATYNRTKLLLSDETMQCEEKHIPKVPGEDTALGDRVQ